MSKLIEIGELALESESFGEKAEIEYMIGLCKSQTYTRNVLNQTGSVADPEYMMKQMIALADNNPKCTIEVVQGEQLREKDMNCRYAVGKRAECPPRLVALHYKGNPDDPVTYAFVGKGVTFDCGGLNLKPTGFIENMYLDKGGACAVLGLRLFFWFFIFCRGYGGCCGYGFQD